MLSVTHFAVQFGVDFGAAGRFCGAYCGGSATCPEGYECQNVDVGDGVKSEQCMPSGGKCA